MLAVFHEYSSNMRSQKRRVGGHHALPTHQKLSGSRKITYPGTSENHLENNKTIGYTDFSRSGGYSRVCRLRFNCPYIRRDVLLHFTVAAASFLVCILNDTICFLVNCECLRFFSASLKREQARCLFSFIP
jgi:hypothetical protein